MTSTRFDPTPDATYGRCNVCNLELSTEADARQHMSETLDEARKTLPVGEYSAHGHGVSVLNPSRTDRIRSHVTLTVEYAISEAFDDFMRDVDAGDLTADEVKEALGWPSDFRDAWDEYLSEWAA